MYFAPAWLPVQELERRGFVRSILHREPLPGPGQSPLRLQNVAVGPSPKLSRRLAQQQMRLSASLYSREVDGPIGAGLRSAEPSREKEAHRSATRRSPQPVHTDRWQVVVFP